jgi:hypothetical protein
MSRLTVQQGCWMLLAVIGFLGMGWSVSYLPVMDIPRALEPHYRYATPDVYPNCRQFCARVDCFGSSQCFHEASLAGCSAYGGYACVPCPAGSDCYALNKAQDDRYYAYVDSHLPPKNSDSQAAQDACATFGLVFIVSGLGLISRLNSTIRSSSQAARAEL